MTEQTIKGDVANGERVEVSFPWFAGRAGVQRTEEGWQVAYFSRAVVKLPAIGRVGETEVKVLASTKSKLVDGVTVLTVEPVEQQP